MNVSNPRSNSSDNPVLREYDYHKLNRTQTAQLLESSLKMIDLHFNCDGQYLETCKDTDYYESNPVEIFNKIDSMFRHLCTTEADNRFLDYVINNTSKPFKWWKFNGECVNLSKNQYNWWFKQLRRYGIDSDFLQEDSDPGVSLSSQMGTTPTKPLPRFSELFE